MKPINFSKTRWGIKLIKKSLILSLIIGVLPPISAANTFFPNNSNDGLNKDPIPQQSTTGPEKPIRVVLQDLQKTPDTIQNTLSETLINVPSYLWRHGCGPTALGMVVGFFDSIGFEDLIPGDPWVQTNDVDQVIASGGDINAPFPHEQKGHFEDYSLPIDQYPDMKLDAYITAGIDPHPNDSLADFMHTSKSEYGNYYGWSWSSDVSSAFELFVQSQSVRYHPSTQFYYGNGMSWSVLQSEIEKNRPMVFLVDSNSDGSTDHFVTIIGYRTSPTLQYAIWDTWSNTEIRWEDFDYIQQGVPWGIWGGWSFDIMEITDLSNKLYLPILLRN